VTLTGAALTLGGALLAGAAALWAGLLALGEEAAVGEALHTLGDAPPTTVGARVPLHRALHVLGYDHPDGAGRTRSRMWQLQERYVKRLLR